MNLADIKARRDYVDNNGQRVRVTGYEKIYGVTWLRVRHQGRRVSTLLAHPSSIIRVAD